MLGNTFVMVLLCHSSEYGSFEVTSLFHLQGLLLYFTFGCTSPSVVTQTGMSDRTKTSAESAAAVLIYNGKGRLALHLDAFEVGLLAARLPLVRVSVQRGEVLLSEAVHLLPRVSLHSHASTTSTTVDVCEIFCLMVG